MARFDSTPSPSVGVAEPPSRLRVVRAFLGAAAPSVEAPTSLKNAQLTISRHDADDFQDRQIYLFVDDVLWGKVRYGHALTQEVTPGPHRVRAFNTLFSKTLTLDVLPGEHVRLKTGNGFPRAGWLLMMVLHVTYLLVRLEREST